MAHPDLDILINAVVPFAQQMLAEHGAFLPYGGSLGDDDLVAMVGTEEIEGEPSVEDIYAALVDGFRARALEGGVRAVAIVMDVMANTPEDDESDEPTDAICARMEHVNGEAFEVFVPYSFAEDGELMFGEIFAVDADPEIFESAED